MPLLKHFYLYVLLDAGNGLEKSKKVLDVCSDNSSGFGSQSMEIMEDIDDDCSKRVVGKLRDESINKAALQDSTLREDYASESSQDGSINENCSERSGIMFHEGMFHSLDGNFYFIIINLGKDVFVSVAVAEDAASASLVCEYCILEGTCLLCSKSKRYNSTS